MSIQICSIVEPDCTLFGSWRSRRRWVFEKFYCIIVFQLSVATFLSRYFSVCGW